MKNKEITLYELLGLIKDDKAPKTIIFDDTEYEFSQNDKEYFRNINISLADDYNLILCLDDTVEIISDDEFKEIEQLTFEYKNMYGNISQHRQSERDLINAINGIIENQNKLIEIIKEIKDE